MLPDLESWAGREQGWEWQKQIAGAVILAEENGLLNVFFFYIYKEFILLSMNQ